MDIVRFEVDGNVAAVEVKTQDGTVEIIANWDWDAPSSVLRLSKVHIRGPGRNRLGVAGVRRLVRGLASYYMEKFGITTVAIQGAVRTTGASPGRTPAAFTLRRR